MRRSILGALGSAALLAALLAAVPAASAAPATHPGRVYVGPAPAIRGPGHVQTIQGITQIQSTNWSGYADYETTTGQKPFTGVIGSWVQPAATCPQSGQTYAVFWVGLDGFFNDPTGTVEQDGSYVICTNGTPSYYTWWEMYPTNAIQIVGDSVQPGDHITSYVSYSQTTGNYTLKVTDKTNPANSFTEVQACSVSCSRFSAEWIAEAPSSFSVLPLADFGKVTFTGSRTAISGHNGTITDPTWTANSIEMVQSNGNPKAVPSKLYRNGTAFQVTWEHE